MAIPLLFIRRPAPDMIALMADNQIIPTRVVHLDLKGCPPTPRRLIELLNIFAAAGYNAVLAEWEDSFPWTVDKRFRSPTAYTPETIRLFAETAASLDLEVIPLVQCLGHMETPLALADYAHLREREVSCTTLNPTAPGARQLVQAMVDDVLTLLPGVKRLHLGGDEAYGLGEHPDTRSYIEQHGKGAVYMRHVEPILDNLLARGCRPLLWDDMMRQWEDDALARIAPKADLVAWSYQGHPITTRGQDKFIERFQKHGITLWGATAYKGAEGAHTDLPDIPGRAQNAADWADVARRYKMTGLIATAWSRYQTQRPQAIPIDAALDNAVLVAMIMRGQAAGPADLAVAHQFLVEIGQWETFSLARDAMAKLWEFRQKAWNDIQLLREQIALVLRDPGRRGDGISLVLLGILRRSLFRAEPMLRRIKQALEGLMDRHWIDEYVEIRVEPLWHELASLEPLVRQIDPAGYQASGWRICANALADEARGEHPGA